MWTASAQASSGLSQKEVVDNVVTALTSNGMIAPSYWVDPKSGIEYLLTVQYDEQQVRSLDDIRNIPLRSANQARRRYWTRSAASLRFRRRRKWTTIRFSASSTFT